MQGEEFLRKVGLEGHGGTDPKGLRGLRDTMAPSSKKGSDKKGAGSDRKTRSKPVVGGDDGKAAPSAQYPPRVPDIDNIANRMQQVALSGSDLARGAYALIVGWSRVIARSSLWFKGRTKGLFHGFAHAWTVHGVV